MARSARDIRSLSCPPPGSPVPPTGPLAAACEVHLDIQRVRGHPAPANVVVPFFDRPYRTVDRAVPERLLAAVTDPDVARLPPMVGSVEQWAGSVDVLSNPGRRAALRAAYRGWGGAG